MLNTTVDLPRIIHDTNIISFIVVLTILFTANDTLTPLGQNLWDQFLGKDTQEVVNRLSNDIRASLKKTKRDKHENQEQLIT